MMEIEGSDDGHIHNETQKPRLVSGSVRCLYIAIGTLSLALGCVGTVLPLIPTTPLVLMSAVCFSKSSQRLNNWLLSTKFYRKIVNRFVKRREMTMGAKFILLSAITVFMGVSFVLMSVASAPPAARVILAIVWLCHVLYFGFKVK